MFQTCSRNKHIMRYHYVHDEDLNVWSVNDSDGAEICLCLSEDAANRIAQALSTMDLVNIKMGSDGE